MAVVEVVLMLPLEVRKVRFHLEGRLVFVKSERVSNFLL